MFLQSLYICLQAALGANPISLAGAGATRWLSYDNAVSSVRKVYAALLMSMETQGRERKCGKALGFLKFLRKWKTVYTLEMLALVLPQLANLSRSFQVS